MKSLPGLVCMVIKTEVSKHTWTLRPRHTKICLRPTEVFNNIIGPLISRSVKCVSEKKKRNRDSWQDYSTIIYNFLVEYRSIQKATFHLFHLIHESLFIIHAQLNEKKKLYMYYQNFICTHKLFTLILVLLIKVINVRKEKEKPYSYIH